MPKYQFFITIILILVLVGFGGSKHRHSKENHKKGSRNVEFRHFHKKNVTFSQLLSDVVLIKPDQLLPSVGLYPILSNTTLKKVVDSLRPCDIFDCEDQGELSRFKMKHIKDHTIAKLKIDVLNNTQVKALCQTAQVSLENEFKPNDCTLDSISTCWSTVDLSKTWAIHSMLLTSNIHSEELGIISETCYLAIKPLPISSCTTFFATKQNHGTGCTSSASFPTGEYPSFAPLFRSLTNIRYHEPPVKPTVIPTVIESKLKTKVVKDCNYLKQIADHSEYERLCKYNRKIKNDVNLIKWNEGFTETEDLSFINLRDGDDIVMYNCNENSTISGCIQTNTNSYPTGRCYGDETYCKHFSCKSLDCCYCSFKDGSARTTWVATNDNTLVPVSSILHTRRLLSISSPEMMSNDTSLCKHISLTQTNNQMTVLSTPLSQRYVKMELRGFMLVISCDNATQITFDLPDNLVTYDMDVKFLIKTEELAHECSVFKRVLKVGVCDRSYGSWSYNQWSLPECYKWWQWLIVVIILIACIPLSLLFLYLLYLIIWVLYYVLWKWLFLICWRFILLIYSYTFSLVIKSHKAYLVNKLEKEEAKDIEQRDTKKIFSLSTYISKDKMKAKSEEDKRKKYLEDIKQKAGKIKERSQILATERQVKTGKGTSKGLLFATIFMVAVNSTEGCAKTFSLVLDSSQCTVDGAGTQTCTMSSLVMMSLPAAGQDSCFVVKDRSGANIGTFIATVEKQKLTCIKNSLYFTYYEQKTRSAGDHYCDLDGKCASDSRQCINYEDTFNGGTLLIKPPNNGITKLGCDLVAKPGKCAAAGRSCQYWYWNVYNPSEQASEVFDCASWALSVEVTLRLITTSGEPAKSERKTLIIGQANEILGHQAAITGAYTPPSTFTHKCYIDVDSKSEVPILLMVDGCNKRGEYINQRVGTVQCNSIEEAVEASKHCLYSSDMVTVQVAAGSVRTNNHYVDIPKMVQHWSLPLKNGDYLVENDHRLRIPYATIETNALVQLQIEVQDLKLISLTSENICYGEFVSLEGCYSCSIGAKLMINAYTNFNKALMTLTCPDINYSTVLNIDDQKREYELNLLTSIKSIDTKCTITCPGGKTEMSIEGDLIYNNNPNVNNNDTMVGENAKGGGELSFLSLWAQGWFKALFSIAVGIALILVIYVIWKFLIPACKTRTSVDKKE